MACGRVIVASQAGGAAEIADVGRNALGHTPGDAGVLAHRIEQLANDPDLRRYLGVEGRATAEHQFNRSRLATELVPLYRKIRPSS